ncbi:uncharacterized protein [Dendrobates tinctorius]|uniref:uncharacterized protein n=1 Tax=Dendrobates tinctorius TaxID=92724 RepID=UPI003CC9D9F7
MPSCLVNQCNSTTGRKGQSKQIIMHSFPKDISRIKLWLQQTGQIFKDLNTMAQKILDGNQQNKYRLCSLHFTPESYISNLDYRKSLSFVAVPSIFPNVKEGENIIEEDLKKKYVKIQKKKIDARNKSLQHSLIILPTNITIQSIKVGEDLLQVYPTSFPNEKLYAREEMPHDVELTKIGFCNIETQTDDIMLSNSPLGFKEKQAVGSEVLNGPPSSDAAVALPMGLMSKLKLHMDSLLREVPIRFDDVAVYFSAEEWESLGMVDKLMYMDVMLENYYTLFSLGFVFEKPEIISIIEEFQDHYHTADVQPVGMKEEPEYHSENEVSAGYRTLESSVGSKSGRLSCAQMCKRVEQPVCHSEAPTKQNLADHSLYNVADIQSFTVKEEPEYYSETDMSMRYWTAESSMCRQQNLLERSQRCNGLEQPVYHAEDSRRQDLVDQSFYNTAQYITVKEEPEYFSETDVSSRYWTAEHSGGCQTGAYVTSGNAQWRGEAGLSFRRLYKTRADRSSFQYWL